MFVFRKICRALFSWNTRFQIRPFALLPTISSLFCKIFIHPLAEWKKKKTNKTKNKKQRSVMWMDCIYKTNEMLWNQNWKSFDCMSFLRKEFTQFPRHRNIAVQKILKIPYHITQPAQISWRYLKDALYLI